MLAVVILAGAACGSSRTKATPQKDLETARLAVLDYRDLPAGFAGIVHDTSRELPERAKQAFRDCLGVSSTLFDTTPGTTKANSQDFEKADTRVSNSVAIRKARSEIDGDWTALDDPKIESCLERLFRTALRSDPATAPLEVRNLAVQRIAIPTVGDRSAAFRTTMRLAATDGSETDLTADTLLASKGRAGVTLSASNVGAPLDPALTAGMLRKVVDRLKNV